MKILIAHNKYQQRGGEDLVFETESYLLKSAGYEVETLLVSNEQIVGIKGKIKAATGIKNNSAVLENIKEILKKFKPDIVHFHNIFPTLSPASVRAVLETGTPVVLTLHNYRFICAGAMLLRNNKPCEKCLSSSRFNAIYHKCYRSSYIGSFCANIVGDEVKKISQEFPDKIKFITLTEFAKTRFIKAGYKEHNFIVKPNCLSDPGHGEIDRDNKIIYVGRISSEKGVSTLIEASRRSGIKLDIIGDGPDREILQRSAGETVTFLGALPPYEVLANIKKAKALAIPSKWYEGFPMVALEAMGTGTPILASDIGSLSEIVDHGTNGFLLDPFQINDWAEMFKYVIHENEELLKIGNQTRKVFLKKYNQEAGLKHLCEIYQSLI